MACPSGPAGRRAPRRRPGPPRSSCRSRRPPRAPVASAAATSRGVSPTRTVASPPKSAPAAAAARARATCTSSERASCVSPNAPMSRSSNPRRPRAPSLTSASGRMLPVSTDWRAPTVPFGAVVAVVAVVAAVAGGAASAVSAATAPGRACPRCLTSSPYAGACRVRPAMNAATCPRGSGTPAMVSVSTMMARSVRPAIGATCGSSRPNSSANTTPYRWVLRPPALRRVWSTSHRTSSSGVSMTSKATARTRIGEAMGRCGGGGAHAAVRLSPLARRNGPGGRGTREQRNA